MKEDDVFETIFEILVFHCCVFSVFTRPQDRHTRIILYFISLKFITFYCAFKEPICGMIHIRAQHLKRH